MDKFTASNGFTVRAESRITGDRRIVFERGDKTCYVEMSNAQMAAFIEMVDAERDEELGRWRWPENPDYVVYPSDQFAAGEAGGWVRVVHEATSFIEEFARHATARATRADMLFPAAARAYFEAHPERKPWEAAKPGEVWALTMDDGVEHDVFIHEDRTLGGRDGVSAGGAYFDIDDGAGITAGRRIWPEVSDADR